MEMVEQGLGPCHLGLLAMYRDVTCTTRREHPAKSTGNITVDHSPLCMNILLSSTSTPLFFGFRRGQEIWVGTPASLGGLTSIGRGYVGPSLRLSFHFYYSTTFGV